MAMKKGAAAFRGKTGKINVHHKGPMARPKGARKGGRPKKGC